MALLRSGGGLRSGVLRSGVLRSGGVAASSFVTAVRPLESAAEAFTLAAGGEHVKVLVAVDPAAADELGPVSG